MQPQQSDLWRMVKTFPKKILQDTFTLPNATERLVQSSSDNLSAEVKIWFADRNLELTPEFLIFSFHELCWTVIHDDLTSNGKVDCSINIELVGKSCLKFFEPSVKATEEYKMGVWFSKYNPSSMRELGSLNFDEHAYLVRTGLPHQSIPKTTPRTLAAIRFNLHKSRSLIRWEEAVDVLAADLN
jgi:hypothetical protein